MRLRRGNYAILFVLTAAVMMSYLAFSIDGGRMKVAYIQSENAAEAAALTAMSVLRDGGSANEAEAAASAAAQAVRLQRVEHTSVAQEFSVKLDWGGWNWMEQGTSDNLGFRWHPEAADDHQAITVNVGVNGGVASVFGPAIGLVAHGDGDWSGSGDNNYSKEKYEKFEVQVGARAAFRHRDTFVVVDVSKQNEPNIQPIRDALTQYVDTMNGFHVPGDRIAMMAYAGQSWIYDLTDTDQGTVNDAQLMGGGFSGGAEASANPFFVLKDNAATARDVMQIVEPCNVGSDAWYYWYRHMTYSQEAELTAYYDQDTVGSFEYWVVGPPDENSSNTSQLDRFRLDPTKQTNAFMLQYMDLWATVNIPSCSRTYEAGQRCPYFTNLAQNAQPLSVFDQCMSWLASESVFNAFDARAAQNVSDGRRSPIDCHSGHFFENHASGEFNSVRPILSVFCNFNGDEGFDGTPRYGQQGHDGEQLFPDPKYTLAGSWPGGALQRALQSFQARTTRSAEANIVLITASPPNCGPLIGDTWGPTCDTLVRQQLYDAVAAIQAAGNVNLYAIVVGADGDAIATFQGLTGDGIGRGWYATVAVDQLANELTDIARDMKIQVVQ